MSLELHSKRRVKSDSVSPVLPMASHSAKSGLEGKEESLNLGTIEESHQSGTIEENRQSSTIEENCQEGKGFLCISSSYAKSGGKSAIEKRSNRRDGFGRTGSVDTASSSVDCGGKDSDFEMNSDLIETPDKFYRAKLYAKLSKSKRLRAWKEFQPHASFASTTGESWMRTILSFKEECQRMSLTGDVIEPLEDTFLFVGTLMGIDNAASAACAIFAYIKTRTNISVLRSLETYLSACLSNFQPQSGEKDANKWQDLLKSVRTDWSLACKSPLWRHLSTLLGVIVSVGICHASHLTFNLGSFEICKPALLDTHRSAFDLFDAVLGSVVYFVENCAVCWKTRSLKPLLFGQLETFEEDYHNVIAWWELVQNGNLMRLKGISESHFKTTLRSVGARMRELRETTKGIERSLVENKLLKLAHIEADYTTMKVGAGIRPAPFVYELYGASNQGKSTVMATIDNVLLSSEGLCTDDEFKRSLNVSEKYFSGWRTDMLVMRLDDFCNTKPAFVEHAPTETLLRVANNVPFSAPMADLHQKGRVFVEPEIVPITTNKKDLDAGKYSCNPYSIQRRANIVITVRAQSHLQRKDPSTKSNCGLDASLVAEWYRSRGEIPPEIEDLWQFDVERPVAPEDETTVATYQVINDRNGRPMRNVNIHQLLAYLTYEFKEHRRQQSNLVERHKRTQKGITFCDKGENCKYALGCCALHDYGYKPSLISRILGETRCPSCGSHGQCAVGCELGDDSSDEDSDSDSDNEPHYGEKTMEAFAYAKSYVGAKVERDTGYFASSMDAAASFALLSASASFVQYWSWSFVIPACWYDQTWFQAIFFMMHWKTIKYLWYFVTICNLLVVRFLYLNCESVFDNWSFLYPFALCLIFQANASSAVRAYLLLRLKRSDCLPAVIKRYKNENIGIIFRYVAGLSAIYAVIRFYRKWRRDNLPHSFMNPSLEEIAERDMTPDVYAKLHKERVVYASELAKTVDHERLLATVRKNLMHAELHTPEKRIFVANIVFVSSNVMLIPRHYFEHSPTFEVYFAKENTGQVGGNFRTQLHKDSVIHIPDTDFSLAYCSTGGSFRDITKHFPIAALSGTSKFISAWRQEDGTTLEMSGTAGYTKVHNNARHDGNTFPDFVGGYYIDITHDTFFGMCGMPIIVSSITPVISGFHLGGKAGTKQGCFGTITQQQLNTARDSLTQGLTRMRTTQDSGLPEHIMQKTYIVNADVRKKSPMNFLPHGAQLRYFGPCIGAVTNKSLVVDHVISPSVALECSYPNKYRGPKLSPSWWPWQQCLANVCHPAREFEESLLERCATDYVKPLIDIVVKNSVWNQCEPLTEIENLNGIPGTKFIDAMKINTSVGFPLSGKKSQFIVDPEDIGNRHFTPEFLSEIDRIEELFLAGDRANIPAKACVKMEVHTKDKARVFYSCPMALVYLTRKYFLPIARLMQMYPALSECAVGINAHSKEWEHMIDHATSKGKKRIVAGDYSKYDQKLTAQLIITALNVLIFIAKHMNYTSRDIRVMEGIASELAYPMVAFNGDLVQFMSGGWISGTAITVHVNGICGALNQRYVFFTLYPEAEDFRSHVALLTYGDDNIGSVDEDHTDFNIKTISSVLDEYGQTYTMPDKTSELTEFLPLEELEFLKRKSVYHLALGCSTGALCETSIFKALHCRVKDKSCPLTNDEAAAVNITGALNEFFHHGRTVYEERHAQLRKIAQDHKLTHLVHGLDLDYEDRVSLWFVNYGSEEERLAHTTRAEIARKRCSYSIDLEFRLDSDSVCDEWEGSS